GAARASPEPSPEPGAHRHLAGEEVAAADRHRETEQELADSARSAARALHAGREYSEMSGPAASVDNAPGGADATRVARGARGLRLLFRRPAPRPAARGRARPRRGGGAGRPPQPRRRAPRAGAGRSEDGRVPPPRPGDHGGRHLPEGEGEAP